MNNLTLNIEQSGSHPFPRSEPALQVEQLKVSG
jgi:hypothetical protein